MKAATQRGPGKNLAPILAESGATLEWMMRNTSLEDWLASAGVEQSSSDFPGGGEADDAAQAAADASPNLVTVCNNSCRFVYAESRTQTAFRWSVLDLFERGRPVYFWTFTVVDAMPSWQFTRTWGVLMTEMFNYFGRLRGVRVFEWHKNHGLHSHMLVDERLSVAVVRRISRRFGFGRIQVARADIGAALYLAKYLGKDRGRIPYGGRSWARLGGNGPRVSDVVYESKEASYLKRRVAALRLEGIKPYKALEIAKRELLTSWCLPQLRALGWRSDEMDEVEILPSSEHAPF